MEVDGDEEEEDAHVYPITCAELLSGEFNCLDGRQNWDTLDTRLCRQLEVESEKLTKTNLDESKHR